ncbi:transcriptional regulator [Marinobacter lipolyticus]|uniref:helix-turn-helix domain-containing protein n=1 Tax=Marinobacter lipolyticus TaxID=209639 RepID=UPI001BCF7096|nr:transcriptional regulator [Marinobacter lipolyticus]MBS8240887.1 transcriptional regulator [Marinobacter lipolyticus]|tara:strand:- start:40 stop:456 length:417 start_codon:yes stop_codon:yes gene_type:complete
MISPAVDQIRDALAQVPFLAHIETPDDYEQALELMGQLVDDYDANKPLIEILSVSIERWEDHAEEFSDFNATVAGTDPGIAVLKTLMAQHRLGVADLPELGSKGNVSKILNGADGKKLARKHIEALSKRFGVSPALFF